jgi:nitrate reductase NapAB chaperone NapD
VNVVAMPPRANDVPAQLRRLADEIEAGRVDDDAHIVTVITRETGEIEVKGWGRVDNLTAIATLNLGLLWLTRATLKEMET